MLRLLAAFVCLATPVLAQNLNDHWQEIGRIEAMIDGQPVTFVVPLDVATSKANAQEKNIMGNRSINVLGAVVGEDGAPGRPQLQLTFFAKDGAADLLSMEIFDSGGYNEPLVAEPGTGERRITQIAEPEPGSFEGTFDGVLIRLTGYMSGAPVPVEGEAPVTITGTFEFAVPHDN